MVSQAVKPGLAAYPRKIWPRGGIGRFSKDSSGAEGRGEFPGARSGHAPGILSLGGLDGRYLLAEGMVQRTA